MTRKNNSFSGLMKTRSISPYFYFRLFFSCHVKIVWSSIHVDGDFSEYQHAVEQMKQLKINIIILQLHESMHRNIFKYLSSAGMVSEGYAYFTTHL